jgi:hypothetical protein
MGEALPPLERSDRPSLALKLMKGFIMSQSVYKVVTLVGSSSESWEKAATVAIAQAAKSL